MDIKDGKIRGSQVAGASVNYSPEFSVTEPNLNLLKRLADTTGGKVLDPLKLVDNPFIHDRQRTFQPRDLWEWLLKIVVVLFVLDVGIRRIQLDREEWVKATATLRRWLVFWKPVPRPSEADESLGALLARREQVRAKQTAPAPAPNPELFRPQTPVVISGLDKPASAPVTPIAPSPEQQAKPTQPRINPQAPPTASSKPNAAPAKNWINAKPQSGPERAGTPNLPHHSHPQEAAASSQSNFASLRLCVSALNQINLNAHPPTVSADHQAPANSFPKSLPSLSPVDDL